MDLSLYLITDSRGMDDEEFYARVRRAVSAGVTMVQLREKEASSAELYKKACMLRKICTNVPLLINDRVDIALAVNADGVHLGQEDIPISIARNLLGKDKIIGATAKTTALVRRAQEEGADYFGIGAFFATDTKSDAHVMSAEQIRAVNDSVDIPSVGIGGLTYDNIDIIRGSGVSGAAVSAAIMHAVDIEKAVADLREKIKSLQ